MLTDAKGNVIEALKPSTAVTLDGTAASVQSAAQITDTVVRLAAIDNVWIKTAANPTAVAEADNNFYLPAGAVEYLVLTTGNKLAVIGGKLNMGVCL